MSNLLLTSEGILKIGNSLNPFETTLGIARGANKSYEKARYDIEAEQANCVYERALTDFGLARKFADPPRPMTPRVVTLWYRSPEILLGDKMYTTAADMWSIGCIFAELLKNAPLLPGKSDPNQLLLITTLLGFPTSKIWPTLHTLPLAHLLKPDPIKSNEYSQVRAALHTASSQAVELVLDLLVYDPVRRVDVVAAQRHAYFRREGPNPCLPAELRIRVRSEESRWESRDRGGEEEGGVARLRRKLEGGGDEEGGRNGGGGKRGRRESRRGEEEEGLELGARPFQQFDLREERIKRRDM
ncbi:Cyclin-dependent kinase 10 [Podochytrium sp. JEL0797]|nr:Cyclin-dependent kinase 10 [Podochytrium sp. JEL0797]